MWLVYVLLKKKIFFKIFYEKCDLKTSSRPYLIFKESSVKRNLRTSLSTDKNWHWKSEYYLRLVIFYIAVYLSAMEQYHVLAHNVANVSFLKCLPFFRLPYLRFLVWGDSFLDNILKNFFLIFYRFDYPVSPILSWQRSLSYKNQTTDLQSKSMDWFLHDWHLGHERVNFFL